jgi:uncharacterized membrane protein
MQPMFFYAGVYDEPMDADADYEAIRELHAGEAIGSYDSATITKQPNGEVKVTKTEKPAQHGAWVGLAAGAGAAVVFPFLLPGLAASGAAGAGPGAWFGHLAHGTSGREAREIGAMLEDGIAALVVVGLDHDAELVEQGATRARQHVLKREVADWDEAEQEALSAIERGAKAVA